MLHATPEPGISYAWRSILKGIQLLKEGIIWRVGDGDTINIWTDPWIPRGSTRKLISQKGRHQVYKVSELINPTTNTWDTDLVQQTFAPEDAELILQIPIYEHTEEGRMSCTWKKIWRLPLPNKVLHFLWRVANYSLPLRMKLQRRG
nr:uncharacterized protein LOC127301723 [Lolium perenne]